MKGIWNTVKNISAVIGVLAVLFGFTAKGIGVYNDIMNRLFKDHETKVEAERFHEKIPVERIDRIRLLDSIERVTEAEWKATQEQHLKRLDSLVRLGVFLTNEGNKKIDHTLEHID